MNKTEIVDKLAELQEEVDAFSYEGEPEERTALLEEIYKLLGKAIDMLADLK